MSNLDAGMNVAEVEELSYSLKDCSDVLARAAQQLDVSVRQSRWQGPVAASFKQQWWPGHRSRLLQVASELQRLSQAAFRQAAEQRLASDDGPGFIRRLPTPFSRGIENQRPRPPENRVVAFPELFNRQERMGQDEFEILRVSDNPPRYIVNLPGVEFSLRDPWEQDHLRDLRGASAARLTGNDAYAERIKLEMQRAGVPPGAEVMLVGHSYGAIAAMNVAKDHSFNQPGNSESEGPYHVQVTHVLAAGAGLTDWIDDPPKGTNVLMAVNRNDVVASGIQQGDMGMPHYNPLDGPRAVINDVFDVTDPHSTDHGEGRVVMEFSANAGPPLYHHYDNYERGLNSADAKAEAWMTEAANKYFAGGGGMQAVRVSVPDAVSY